jgi:hypothetical protein
MRMNGIRALLVVLFIMLPAIAAVPTVRAGDTVTLSTTVDFDAGTSNLVESNYDVETETYNAGMNADIISPGNYQGDTFAVEDDDGDTYKWNPIGQLGGAQQYITSGRMVHSLDYNPFTTDPFYRTMSTYSTGVTVPQSGTEVVEAEVYLKRSMVSAQSWWIGLRASQTDPDFNRLTGWGRIGFYQNNIFDRLRAEYEGGASAEVDATGKTEVWLRITAAKLVLSGTPFRFYYKWSLADDWSLLLAIGVNFEYYEFMLFTQAYDVDSSFSVTAEYDDFIVRDTTIGTTYEVGHPPVRQDVNYITQTITPTDVFTIDTIELQGTVSSAAYVDEVAVQLGGTDIFVFTDDWTSGTTNTYSYTGDAVSSAFTLRIRFRSDGENIPIVSSITVTFVDASPPPAGGGEEEGPPGTEGLPGLTRQPSFFLPCTNITIEDTRPAADNAILYMWAFGDGTINITTEPRVSHTYEEEGIYTVTARVQYSDGTIEFLTIRVDARTSKCYVGGIISSIFPVLLAMVALLFLTAIMVGISRMKEPRRRKIIKWVSSTGVLIVVFMFAVAVYAFLVGAVT